MIIHDFFRQKIYFCVPLFERVPNDQRTARAPARSPYGEVAERSIVAVSKTVVRATVPGVRIPPSPLKETFNFECLLFYCP